MNASGSRSGSNQASLGVGTLLGAYLAIVFLGGSLLAPWVYWGVHALAGLTPLPKGVLEAPFHRYVNRMFLVIAVVGLVPLWRRLEGGQGGWRDCFPGDRWKDYWRGWFLGFLSLAILAGMGLIVGARQTNTVIGWGKLATHCFNAGMAALVVGFLEEMLFRGLLFRGLRKQHRFATAAAISSGLYALVHFLRRPPPPAVVEWWTGLQTLGLMAEGFLDLRSFMPAFINLFLAGFILAMTFQATAALWFSAGLHAGWIFWLKSYGHLTAPAGDGNAWVWGTNRLIDGWFATIVLLGVGLGCWRWLGNRPKGLALSG